MKNSKKLLANVLVLALAVLMLFSVTACQPVQTNPPTNSPDNGSKPGQDTGGTPKNVPAANLPEGVIPYTPYDLSGKTITVYTAEGELSNSVNAQKGRFIELTGCAVNVVAIPMANFKQKLSVDLASKSNEYDVIVVPAEQELVDNGWVEPLTKYVTDAKIADPNLKLDDFIPALLQVMTNDGVLYGFPWKPDAMVYYYRKDLFNDEANKAAFKEQYGYDLAPAKTWEQYFDIAKFFTRPEENLYGSLFMGMNHLQLSNNVQTRFYGTGLYWFDENYKSNLNTPEFKKVLESFRWELQNTTPPGTENWEWPETNTAFLSGMAAQHVTWPGLSKMVETPEGDWGKSEVVGKVGWTTVPGWKEGKPATMAGGWWTYVSSFAKEKVAAYKFIEFITSQEGEHLKIATGCDPARQSNFNMLAKENPFMEVFGDSLGIGVPAPLIPRWSSFEIEFLDAIHGAITGQVPIEDAMKEADDTLNNFLKSEGLQK
jgi:multiple sugar transport system substrate-binding protein